MLISNNISVYMQVHPRRAVNIPLYLLPTMFTGILSGSTTTFTHLSCWSTAVTIITLLVLIVRRFLDGAYRKELPLPPGPRPLPVVGNILDIPKAMSAREYRKLSDIYGT